MRIFESFIGTSREAKGRYLERIDFPVLSTKLKMAFKWISLLPLSFSFSASISCCKNVLLAACLFFAFEDSFCWVIVNLTSFFKLFKNVDLKFVVFLNFFKGDEMRDYWENLIFYHINIIEIDGFFRNDIICSIFICFLDCIR